MGSYEDSMNVMHALFAKDCQFALATANGNTPSVRIVDTFYDEGAFYVVAHAATQKVKEITTNENVSLCHHLYRFNGKAQNIGHPLLPQNAKVRDMLTQAFAPWYFEHNNEQDKNMCFIRIAVSSGFFYKDGTGYSVDFLNKTAESFPFDFQITAFD